MRLTNRGQIVLALLSIVVLCILGYTLDPNIFHY